ncbi:fibronectin type III domain-containing protein [Amycolatopsis sp. OK19-0408]|uniref:Fibronectin type III domain-containing protein n=1 Tax=Amycolatopsis iheyensis TaxID=2945988 RepID=A0A9X2NN19_9PSEU|nr:fibronectin type III domain-containing protein [Amycolatopsis iheyensis]MCR6489604.1 fibronectin type III domain-containing protein [Amycolatopsis iheyensis]
MALFLGVFALPTPAARADESCPDLLVLGSRGSGESATDVNGLGPTVEEFAREFRTAAEAAGKTVEIWGNGVAPTPEETAEQYPAVPVKGWEGWVNGLGAGAAVGTGILGRYNESVTKGVANLKRKAESVISACQERTQLVLSGFSQGAQVTETVYRALTSAQRDRVLGVALFGNPLLNGRSRTSLGTLDRNRNGLLTNWFNSAPPAEFPAPWDKVRSYCHALDPVCQGLLRWSLLNPLVKTFEFAQHGNYPTVGDGPGQDTYPVDAAKFFAARVRPAPPSSGPEATITPVDGAVPGQPFVVSAAESSDPAGRPLSYAWDLDGSGRYATASDGALLETSFAAAGDYPVGLKVTNDAGQSAVATTSVHVGSPGPYTGLPGAPTAVTWAPAADHESATISWQPPLAGPPPAEGYEVVTPDGQLVAVVDHAGAASVTVRDDQLPLTVVIRAVNRRGASVGTTPIRLSVPSEVMVVGDSISQGSAGDFTWRYRFDKHETAAGADLALVGPRDDLFDNVANTWNDNHTYADPAFAQHHDAIWGESMAGAAARVGDDVAAHHPDYLLVLLGINDLGFGMADPAGTETSLRTFVANARGADPGVQFVFGTLLPTQRTQSEPAFAASVADFNGRLRRAATELSTMDSEISVAEPGQDIVPQDDLWDGTHPNARGEGKIAAAFADTLARDFSVGTAYPRPYPAVPLGPRVVPQLSATAGSGQVDLSWTLSPGATGYYVHTKDVTAGETAFTRLPYPVTGPQWTAGLLTNGHTYEFQLKATKGTAEGVFSTVATATPTGPAPGVVTDLTATAGTGSATLQWTPVENATGYYVFRKNVTAGETTFTQLPWPVSGPTWVAELLNAGETYQFQLQAVNGGIRGGLSNVATVAITGATPAAVTTLTATPGDGRATLSWTPVANATGYYVFRKNVTAGETAFMELPWPVSGPTWVAEQLTPGATYQFQLQAANGRLRGGLSNTATATVTGPAPAAVTDLTAEASGDGEATLSWTRVANATGYYIHVKNVSAGETAFTKLPWPVAGPSWVSAGLVPGAHYQYRVQGVNGNILGALSNTADVTLTGTRPPGVTDLRATAGNGQATLAWTPVGGATGYYVYQRNVSAGEADFTQLRYPVTGSSWVAAGLTPGGRYEFKLQSVNGLVRGGFSTVAGVTAGGTTPGGPADLRATPGNGAATLTWTPVGSATGYYVYQRNVSAGETGFTQLPFPVTGSSWVASGLTPGGRYDFQLQSVNGLLRGGFSNVAGVTAGGVTPAGPGNLRATAGDRAVTLNWTPAANATAYYVYVRNASAPEPGFTRLAFPVPGSSWTARGLVAGAVYQFQLRSINGYLEGGYSSVVTVTSGGVTPAGPGNLVGVAAGGANGRVALSWTPAANATGYYVYQRNVTAREAFKQLPYPVTGSSWNADGLVPGATYEFQLRSLNGYLGGGYSNVTSSIAGGYIPAGPTSLRAVRDVFSVTLLWTPSANTTGYFIYMRDVTAFETGFHQLPYPVTGVSWTVDGLTPGHNYQFYLQSLNYLLYGNFSSTISVQLWQPWTNVDHRCDWHAEVPHSDTYVHGTGYPPNRRIKVYFTLVETKTIVLTTSASGEWYYQNDHGAPVSPARVVVNDEATGKMISSNTGNCGGDPGTGRMEGAR